MQLRYYQDDIFQQVSSSSSDDIVQLDTGGGKTPIEAKLAERAEYSLLVAHRNVLITQISEKLAAFGVEHDTISTEHTRRRCISEHLIKHGMRFIVRGHKTHRVASIDSLVSRWKRGKLDVDCFKPWLIIIDEAHHVIPDNKWGMIKTIFPNARIIGFTATPARMDGESLHISKGGLFEKLIQATSLTEQSTRELMNIGALCDYEAYSALRWHLYKNDEHIGQNGLDYENKKLTIAGDPIAEYRGKLNGQPTIMMCPSIKNAEEFAEQFRDAGIPSACIHSLLSSSEISRILDAFASGRIWVLTNVDMIGEGFDMPAVTGLIIATRTASFIRFKQWIGRILRPSNGKERGIVIDMTGMIGVHGMPDDPVKWDLINPPVGVGYISSAPCFDCGFIYKINKRKCPKCGAPNELLEDRQPVGGFYFEIDRLDRSLILQERQAIRKEAKEARLRTEIISPSFHDGNDIVGKTIGNLRAWFIESLQRRGVEIIEINAFLAAKDAANKAFWMSNFTAHDIKDNREGKAVEVFRKWKKAN